MTAANSKNPYATDPAQAALAQAWDEGFSAQFASQAILEVLSSAGLDLITVNQQRMEVGELPVTGPDELILSAVMLLVAKLSSEEVAGKLLAEEFDALRLRYAEMSGTNATIQRKLAPIAKSFGKPELQALVRDMHIESKAEVLKRLPSGTKILKSLRGEL